MISNYEIFSKDGHYEVYINNEFYCTHEDITNKLNAEINTLFEYKDEVVITDISQIIMNICWKYEKSLKNN